MVQEPNRTPGKAEGAAEPDEREEETEPGRTPEQAEGSDDQAENESQEHLKQSMQHDERDRQARSRDKA